jgi:hypothetical protein
MADNLDIRDANNVTKILRAYELAGGIYVPAHTLVSTDGTPLGTDANPLKSALTGSTVPDSESLPTHPVGDLLVETEVGTAVSIAAGARFLKTNLDIRDYRAIGGAFTGASASFSFRLVMEWHASNKTASSNFASGVSLLTGTGTAGTADRVNPRAAFGFMSLWNDGASAVTVDSIYFHGWRR